MKSYIGHKLVEAAMIVAVTPGANPAIDGAILELEGGDEPFKAGPEMIVRYTPVAGDRLVRYRDGFLSISPKVAFEEGYSPLREGVRILEDIPEQAPEDAAANAEYRRIVDIARVCHEANRAYCASLGDLSQPEWSHAPHWQQKSAMVGVLFNRAYPDAPPSASHDSWLEEKRRDGWSYGPVKDPELKQHPCFVPYDELPAEQRRKDALFKAIVNALSADEDGERPENV